MITALQAGDPATALVLARAASKNNPSDPRLWTLQALSQERLRQWDGAMAAYTRALAISPDYLPALKGAAELAYNQRLPGAQLILERLVRLQPADQLAEAMLGELELQRAECKQADYHLAQAPSAIASQAGLLQQYSRCLVSLGEYERASAIFDRLSELNPGSSSPLYNSAVALTKIQRWQDALRRLQPLIADEKPSVQALTLAGFTYEQIGDTQQAVTLLRRAIALYPHEEDAYLDFVALAYRHESVPVGLEIVSLGVQQNPQSAELHFVHGVLLCGLGRTSEGLSELDEANRLDPHLKSIDVAHGIAETQANHSAEAVERFRKATQQNPKDPLAWYLLAEVLAQQKYPQDSGGYVELERVGQKAVELNPDKTDAYDLMASFYLQANQLDKATAFSKEALKRDPQDTQALYHLVLITRKDGNKEGLNQLVQRLVQARTQESIRAAATHLRTLVIEQPSTSDQQNAASPTP